MFLRVGYTITLLILYSFFVFVLIETKDGWMLIIVMFPPFVMLLDFVWTAEKKRVL